jgi:hypothetical protein
LARQIQQSSSNKGEFMNAGFRLVPAIAGIVLLSALAASSACDSLKPDALERKVTRQQKKNPIQAASRWTDIVGHRVAVEGLAWEQDKGLTSYAILNGGLVYIENKLAFESKGKPVRVVGILTLRHIKKAPPEVQGYTYDFDAFVIKPDQVKVPDKATWPWMEDFGTPGKPLQQ